MTRKLFSLILALCMLMSMTLCAAVEPFTGTAQGFGGQVTDFFQFQRTAAGENIGMNDRNGAGLEQLHKVFL